MLFLFFICLEFLIIRFVISTFTQIFFIEMSFVLLPPPPGGHVLNLEETPDDQPTLVYKRDTQASAFTIVLQVGRERSTALMAELFVSSGFCLVLALVSQDWSF